MRGSFLQISILAAVAACGPSKGDDSSEGSSGAEATSAAQTEATSGTTTSAETDPTSGGTDPTGPAFDSTCEMFFANRDAAAGILVMYRFGNQIEGSDVQIYIDGSIYHNERTCCPPEETFVAETLIEQADLIALKSKAAAVIAADTIEENLGPMAEGQQTGLMCVLLDGKVGTVRAFEAGDEVIKRSSAAPEAADIAAVILGYATIDMPE